MIIIIFIIPQLESFVLFGRFGFFNSLVNRFPFCPIVFVSLVDEPRITGI